MIATVLQPAILGRLQALVLIVAVNRNFEQTEKILHHENFYAKYFNENFPIYSTRTHTWGTSMATEVTLLPISLFVIPEQEFTKIVIAATH